MKASPQAQLKLLELADLDAELSRLEHRRRTLPENEQHERGQARDAELRVAKSLADEIELRVAGALSKTK